MLKSLLSDFSGYTPRRRITGLHGESESVSRSVMSLHFHGLRCTRLLCPWDSPGVNTGVGCHAFLQGIFPTQGANPCLLHYRWILYYLSHQSHGNYMFNFGRNCHTAFYHSCTILHSHRQGTWVPGSPHSPQHMLFSVMFLNNSQSIKWERCLIAVLICLSLMISDVEHLPMYLLASVCLLQRNAY